MAVPRDMKFTRTHEWVRLDGDVATIGITDFAQQELGDITYLELPQPGEELNQTDSFGVIESVKAASDVYMPLTGEIVESNSEAEEAPELINQSPFEAAWLIKVRVANTSELEELMDAEAYEAFLEEGGGH